MMVRTMLRCVLPLLAALAGAPVASHGDESVSRDDLRIPMSDGVELAADLYRPGAGQKFPVVLVRTPYTRAQFGPYFAEPMAKRGYAVVMQDVRGMGDSQGMFIPFINERKDGLETLDWITKQPWCDGSVGMWGASYLGYCTLIVAPEQHPSLKAIFCISGWSNAYEMSAPGGAMHLMLNLPWTLSGQIRGQENVIDWPRAFGHVPVTEIPKAIGIESPAWEAASKMFTPEVLVGAASIAGRYGEIRTPIFYFTGWYDMIARNTIDTYERVELAAGDKRPFQKLFVGPWHHDQEWLESTKVGDEDFGPDASMGISKIVDIAARWFDRWLKGVDNGVDKEPPVTLFVMGENKWRSFDRWPPTIVQTRKYYLASKAGANGLSGDGELTPDPQNEDGHDSDSFVFDPNDPVPTLGGANCHFFEATLGVRDQRPAEERQDVLVYTTTPRKRPLKIIGPLKAVIYAATEGRHMDVTAKLVDVRPDGYARIIDEGIKRGPDSIPTGTIRPIESGKVYCYTVDMGKTAIVIPAGHRLRVEISSSNFPKYSRNPGTGEPPEAARELKSFRQTILHTREHPSHIVLPVID